MRDILAMKVNAIIQRWSKRDFIDVYFLMNEISTNAKDIVEIFLKKYGSNINKMIVYKSMVYFEYAEGEILPKMIKKIDWKDVKGFFIKEFIKFKNK